MAVYPLYVGSKPVKTDNLFVVSSPYNGQTVGEISLAGEKEIEEAIKAAQEAFAVLKEMPAYKRSQILLQIKQGVEKRAEELA